MAFRRLERETGAAIWVNPLHVVSLEAAGESGDATRITLAASGDRPSCVTVKGSPENVLAAIDGALEKHPRKNPEEIIAFIRRMVEEHSK